MYFLKFFSIFCLFFSHSLFIRCNSSYNKKNVSKNLQNFEGYIFLTHTVYEDVDESGVPVRPIENKNDIMSKVNRRIFLSDPYFIDVEISTRIIDGKFIKEDTIGYTLYDISKQKFATFKDLNPDSEPIKTGVMENKGFSNNPKVDPFAQVTDSTIRVHDTIVDSRKLKIIGFHHPDTASAKYAIRAKFSVDPEIRNFPIQLSYILSRKMDNGFVYKMQLPMPDGQSVAVATLDYKPANLDDNIKVLFQNWVQKLNK